MKIGDLLTEALIVEHEMPLSKVISAMGKSGKRDAIVTKNGEFGGIISARDILRKQAANPDKISVGSLAYNVGMGDFTRSINELSGMMLSGDYSEMPFVAEGGIKTLSKPSLISLLNKDFFRGKAAKDVMSVPYFVSHDDRLSTVRKLLLDLNVSKIPVVDDANNVVGVVDLLSLLGMAAKRESASPGDFAGEKRDMDGVIVSSFMEKDFFVVSEGESLESVAEMMSKKGISCILVENKGVLTGIITPKDLLKLVGKSSEGLYMSLSGYLPDDEIEAEEIKEYAKKTLEKVKKMTNVTYAVMHIEKHQKSSVKSSYSVSARLGTSLGLFTADSTEWNLLLCVRNSMDKILSGVEKNKSKRRALRRANK